MEPQNDWSNYLKDGTYLQNRSKADLVRLCMYADVLV